SRVSCWLMGCLWCLCADRVWLSVHLQTGRHVQGHEHLQHNHGRVPATLAVTRRKFLSLLLSLSLSISPPPSASPPPPLSGFVGTGCGCSQLAGFFRGERVLVAGEPRWAAA